MESRDSVHHHHHHLNIVSFLSELSLSLCDVKRIMDGRYSFSLLPFFFFLKFKFAVDVQMGSSATFQSRTVLQWGRCNHINTSSLCIRKKEQQVNCCLREGVCTGQVLYCIFFPGRRALVKNMSPVPAVGHEEQHLADTAQPIFQRGESQEWQLGSAF